MTRMLNALPERERDLTQDPRLYRNAGFSAADPEPRFLPIVQSLLLHYNGADGGYEDVPSDQTSVFSFLRTHPDESILVAMNFSSHQASALLSLPEHAGRKVSTIVSKTSFQDVGDDGTLRLTFAPHSFYWLVVKRG